MPRRRLPPRPVTAAKGDLAERLTGLRELPWTDARSPWMDVGLVVEARASGFGSGWGRAPKAGRSC